MRNIRKYRAKKHSKKKTNFRKRLLCDITLSVLFLGSLSYLLFISPAFKIHFNETEAILPLDISYYKTIDIIKGYSDNLLLLNSKEVKKEILKKFPQAKNVFLKKIFPHNLLLSIEAREPIAFFCNGATSTDCHLIDKKGMSFDAKTSKELPFIFSIQKTIDSSIIEKVLKIEQGLKKEKFPGIKKLLLAERERLNIETTEGWTIYFNLESDIKLTLTKLKLLLEKEITQEERKNLEYIDLRFSKAYYK